MIRVLAVGLITATLSGCAESSRPPVEVTHVELFAALPGSAASVGYMTLTNNTDDRVGITGFYSSAFGSIELHETTLENGVARMRRVTTLAVPPQESVSLAPGSLHLMLMEPGPEATVGQAVTLTLRYEGGGELLISAPLQSRNAAGRGH